MPGMIQPERKLTWDENDRLTTVSVLSLFSGKWNTMDLGDVYYKDAVTRAQWDAWQGGQSIQVAMPQLGPEEREFLMSGATPEEWDVEFFTEDDADYRGVVSPGEMDWRVYIEDDEGSKPLPVRLDLRNHSPDGFAWGYNGSGPAQLALALLADSVGDAVALTLYQRFKAEVVASWDQHGVWTYSRAKAREWAKTRLDIDKR